MAINLDHLKSKKETLICIFEQFIYGGNFGVSWVSFRIEVLSDQKYSC